MATHGWRTGRTLKDQLIDEGNTFNYFQLMRLLDLAKASADNDPVTDADPSKPSGQSRAPLNWRIQADLEAGFPASEFRSIEIEKKQPSIFNTSGEEEQLVIAKTSNYCIAGHQGPLPENYTDWIREQQRYGPSAMAAFLDMFNHRINMLRYKAKRDSCQALDERRPDQGILAPGIAAAMGMLGKNLFEQLPLSKRSIMSLSGLMSGRRISAHVIQRVLQKCFGIKTRITDVVGAWRDVAPDQLWHLGKEGVSNIGDMCILGQKNMDMQGRIRVELGPVHIDKYMALLPDLEFSRDQIQVPVRSRNEVESHKYAGHKVHYLHKGEEGLSQNSNSYVVSNVQLSVEPEHRKETLMIPSAFSKISSASGKSSLRATGFAGYLYRPFAAMVKYLTNAKVDVEVLLEVDPDSLPDAYPILCTPDRPQDAYLRLGQSFWLGKPQAREPRAGTDQSEENSRAKFLIDGFEPIDHSFAATAHPAGNAL